MGVLFVWCKLMRRVRGGSSCPKGGGGVRMRVVPRMLVGMPGMVRRVATQIKDTWETLRQQGAGPQGRSNPAI